MESRNEAADFRLVEALFAERGLLAVRVPEKKTKTPDYQIFEGQQLVAYCEVKSPQDVFVERVEGAILEGKGGAIETGYGNDYRQGRCLARAATKAAAQFAAVNPDHAVPNILMIINHDTMALADDFTQIITGELGALGRVGKPLRDDIPEIDVYVWADVKGEKVEQVHRLFRHENPLKEDARRLLRLG